MTVGEVRSRYLAFFKARGHAIIPSAPIRPENDPTTLFTSSGMQPLVPYLLGQEHPAGSRLADSQLSFRAEDIEEVGDNRHTTFFEMLGNWSLGDYFKQEQLPWIFDFLTNATEGLGFDPDKLYVTVFDGDAEAGMDLDTESVELWKRLFKEKGIGAELVRIGTEEEGYEKGMQGGRIFSYGSKKNWWSRSGVPAKMPPGEPGGPDSEIFYDFGTPHDPRWGKECHVNCDCGRFVEICNSVFMQFVKQADGSFKELPKKNVDFGGGLERLAAATCGNPDVFLIDVFDEPREAIERKAYSFSAEGKPVYKRYGSSVETTKSYRVILDHIRAATFMIADGIRPSNTEQGYVLRRLIRRAVRFGDSLGLTQGIETTNSDLLFIAESFVKSYMTQYPKLAHELNSILQEIGNEEKRFRKTLQNGMKELEKYLSSSTLDADAAYILFTSYGFPFELTEEVAKEHGIEVDHDAFQKRMEEHQAQSRAGAAQKFAGGLADHAEQTVRYHTTHHILLKALQSVLGPDVHQRGSNITSERLRIDFSSGRKMTPDEISQVEKIVNEVIYQDLPVTRTVMPRAEAEKLGAEMEFGANYPDMVSVYSVGPAHATSDAPDIPSAFSLEFCGGPHVSNTREIHEGGKHFKILKEEASSAGVRRIKAVLL